MARKTSWIPRVVRPPLEPDEKYALISLAKYDLFLYLVIVFLDFLVFGQMIIFWFGLILPLEMFLPS